jgi:hypothetical protein
MSLEILKLSLSLITLQHFDGKRVYYPLEQAFLGSILFPA